MICQYYKQAIQNKDIKTDCSIFTTFWLNCYILATFTELNKITEDIVQQHNKKEIWKQLNVNAGNTVENTTN